MRLANRLSICALLALSLGCTRTPRSETAPARAPAPAATPAAAAVEPPGAAIAHGAQPKVSVGKSSRAQQPKKVAVRKFNMQLRGGPRWVDVEESPRVTLKLGSTR